ncbi:MAG: three-Cys-motif partner protein TcmP [Planctomycetes bacterium]|jgi:three-Cys-motif partner protein|nr:three-Cys-motif partner protein TcmP [Planctomycetota bacterium]
MAKKKGNELQFDRIGYWSEVKLDIIREYCSAYSRILTNQRGLSHVYVDAFSGAGEHVRKDTSELVPGSPLNALHVDPPFDRYVLIDLDGAKVDHLQQQVAKTGRADRVQILHANCNQVLLEKVLPSIRYESFQRGLVVLDPYGLHLDWQVLATAGKSGVVEVFLNFPIMDMNRNALWRNPDAVGPDAQARMTRFWGDESWRSGAYKVQRGLFGEVPEKLDNNAVVDAFRKRLRDAAGFSFVHEPMPMRNEQGAVVYYLFFAGPNRTGAKIVSDIFRKHANRTS